jgi:hypothetical protein
MLCELVVLRARVCSIDLRNVWGGSLAPNEQSPANRTTKAAHSFKRASQGWPDDPNARKKNETRTGKGREGKKGLDEATRPNGFAESNGRDRSESNRIETERNTPQKQSETAWDRTEKRNRKGKEGLWGGEPRGLKPRRPVERARNRTESNRVEEFTSTAVRTRDWAARSTAEAWRQPRSAGTWSTAARATALSATRCRSATPCSGRAF